MLFRAREKAPLAERLRLALWPRVSWSRSARYMKKRVLRLAGSPYAIAAGVGVGVFSAFTPFLGLHIVIAIILAFLIGGNVVAAALGTTFANPLTLPFIWASTYKVGRVIIGGPHFPGPDDVPANLAEKSVHAIWPVIKPMMVGSIPLGIVAGLIFYVIVFLATRAFQTVRRERLATRRRERSDAAARPTRLEDA
ncbi:MAG: DUF2062 domain-containing protein [Bauldia sp.]|nr:DUF2062 domain-containing protein [Bauldia sp.]